MTRGRAVGIVRHGSPKESEREEGGVTLPLGSRIPCGRTILQRHRLRTISELDAVMEVREGLIAVRN